jgi:hypothetical protein
VSEDRQIWFKKSLGRYYPVHLYGWIWFVCIIVGAIFAYFVLDRFNQRLNLVNEALLPFFVLIPSLVLLFRVVKTHS